MRGDYNLLAQVGATYENKLGTARILHTDGWENAVASSDSLTTANLFDEDAVYYDDANGFISGSALGRVIYLGLNLKM